MDELNRLNVSEFKKIEKIPLIVVLDNIRSLNNIGSVFRTSDAFRVESVFLCGITACPPHRDIHKTALGATESVDWRYFDHTSDAVKLLKEMQYEIIGIEQTDTSISLSDFVPVRKTAIIFGNEVEGVDPEVLESCHRNIEIPQEGTKHSLNISVCAGIVIWHIYSQFAKIL
jgi:tRNA G18 (ribose-2'-O)-methylase SpoU